MKSVVNTCKIRKCKEFMHICAALSVQEWCYMTKQNDVNKSYEGFVNIFNELHGIHCPLKRCASEIKGKIGHGLLKVWQMRVKRI